MRSFICDNAYWIPCLVFLAFSCAGSPHNQQASPSSNSTAMKSIRYVDFNNNVYSIQPESIHYRPIKPKESSSGVYSGGEESTAAIEAKTFQRIREIVAAIEADSSLHLQQRPMLTAILYVYPERGESRKYIIGKSDKQRDLEGMLKERVTGK